MPHHLQKQQPKPDRQLKALEQEIAFLEEELRVAENKVNVFTAQIRNQLSFQINRIQELVALFKQQKREKKGKRLEQKKKGKHYKTPPNLPAKETGNKVNNKFQEGKEQDLKRLYKEAIVQVHPDKFVEVEDATTQKAHELTLKLNELYESGDLEELKGFHAHILSGNAMAHIPYQPDSVKDPAAMLVYLQQQKTELQNLLQELKSSELFHVLETYTDPLTFIPELRQQFEERILIFEKRTRLKKGKNK